MRNETESAKTLTISLPANLYRGLEQLALDNDRSKNYLMKKAAENLLEDAYFSKRAEEILARNEPTVTLEELIEKYGLSEKYGLPNKARKTRRKKS
jgi:predicted DNA-binding protein